MRTIKESYFWQQVKAGLEDANTHLCRIENTAGTGISDINACRNGIEIWIELKVFHRNRLYFRNSQRSWILNRVRVGGRVYVLARNDAAMMLYSAASLMRASFVSNNDERSFSIEISALPESLYVCQKPFKWEKLREILFNQSV